MNIVNSQDPVLVQNVVDFGDCTIWVESVQKVARGYNVVFRNVVHGSQFGDAPTSGLLEHTVLVTSFEDFRDNGPTKWYKALEGARRSAELQFARAGRSMVTTSLDSTSPRSSSMSNALQQQQQKHFESILREERARMRAIGGPNDWRIKLYDKSKWEMRVLKANFNSGKQGVTLPKGTVVAAQKSPPDAERDYDQWCILHGNLICKTSLGPKYAKYI